MEQAEEDGYSWVLTMDQDSVLPDGMVEDFIKYTGTNENVGIICPQVIDKRRAYMQVDKSEEIKYLDMCITSASCTSISAWKVVGKFDEWLFIDLVDNEFCKRLIASGYKILQVNKWVLDQEFGKIIPKSKRKQRFWIEVSRIFHNENIAKLSYKKYVNPLRVYYTNRNIIYVNKKLRKYGMVAYENYNCKEYIGFWVCFNIPSILRAQSKIEVVKAIIRGVKDGTEVCVDEWVARKDKI
jgi:GT2 family glycosyltransferase